MDTSIWIHYHHFTLPRAKLISKAKSPSGPGRKWRCSIGIVRTAGPAAMEAVLNELLSVEDLLKFERKFQSEKAAGSVSKSTQFEHAWCLVRSQYNDDIRKGLALLEGEVLG